MLACLTHAYGSHTSWVSVRLSLGALIGAQCRQGHQVADGLGLILGHEVGSKGRSRCQEWLGMRAAQLCEGPARVYTSVGD